MTILSLFDHLLDICSLFGLFKGVFLPCDYIIGLTENDLDLFLVGAGERILILGVLFVLRMQMKDNLSKLSYLL
jgi:hypothetical protein